MVTAPEPALHQLARLYGVQTTYVDIRGGRQHAAPAVLVRVLRALGASLETEADAAAAVRARRAELWDRGVEPVVVAWDDAPATLSLRRLDTAVAAVDCTLELESGERRRWTCDLGHLPVHGTAEIEGRRYVSQRVPLPGELPRGYHRLALETGHRTLSTTLIAAPRRAHQLDGNGREWGAFVPLYALRTERDWGAGDLTDLAALMDAVGDLGGRLVGTLPLLAAFLDLPYEPSPYAPASRLFWNELYLDVAQAAARQGCAAAQSRLASADLQAERAALRAEPHVDYRRLYALKRSVLEPSARAFFADGGDRGASFHRFLAERPLAEDYARFRAAVERQGAPWPAWPEPLRGGVLREGDYDADASRYHLYAQWLMEQQLAATATHGLVRLYLDLPLGVHSDGYDTWRQPEAFVAGVSAGAPPDTFFTGGQNWGFAPLHPRGIREQGYRYFIACIRHHLRYAGVLRVDHVMGLHRLFWIPHGLESREGIYVRYPAEELYAVLSLESHRHQAPVVGEDLGIVPNAVRAAMARHAVRRMYVLEYELTPDPRQPLRPPPVESVAGLNTHDMPTFAAFWDGLDLHDRQALGLLDDAGVAAERQARSGTLRALVQYLQREGRLQEPGTPAAVLRACLAVLAAGPARTLLVGLEDLWLEPRPQNVPGTWRERPNWLRKARHTLAELLRLPDLVATLREVDRLRRQERDPQ